MARKKEGRNGEVWRLYCQGVTQDALAERFQVSQARISQIVQEVRASIPEVDRAQLLMREVEFLDQARVAFMELADAEMPPAFDKNGAILFDEKGNVVRDVATRLAALEAAQRTGDRLAKRLGLDATVKVDVDVSAAAQETAAALAAAALARMQGGGDA
jgi:transcriptional regulator with XRE-family HTH domain